MEEKWPRLKRWALIAKNRYVSSELTNTSALMAFYLLLSLFPLLIIVGNLLPYLHMDPQRLLEAIEVLVPDPLESLLEPVLINLLTDSSGGLLSLGAVGLLWSASRGMNYMQTGLNKAYGVGLHTNFVSKRLISLLTLLVMFVCTVALVLVFGFGSTVLGVLIPVFSWAEPLQQTLAGLRWPVVLVFLFCMLAVVYTITPDVKLRVRQVLPGAAFGTVGLVALAEAFAVFVRFSTRSWASYGALSSLFMLMFWLNFSCMILILGAVLNASIQEYQHGEIREDTSGVDDYIRRQALKLAEKAQQKWRSRKDGRNGKTGGAPPAKPPQDTPPPAS